MYYRIICFVKLNIYFYLKNIRKSKTPIQVEIEVAIGIIKNPIF